jgi:transcriptional regulator with XRE-family HTH domain
VDVPALLRAARGTRKVSQRRLAELAGLPRSTVDRIEAGLTDPRIGTLERLFGAIGYELTICTGQGRVLRIDEHREQLVDYGGRHFPPHWEVREIDWMDNWWGWWRKKSPPPRGYTYWWRHPSIGFTPWEDAT